MTLIISCDWVYLQIIDSAEVNRRQKSPPVPAGFQLYFQFTEKDGIDMPASGEYFRFGINGLELSFQEGA